jgi:hypothetical protein
MRGSYGIELACRQEMVQLNQLVPELEVRVAEQQRELEAAHKDLTSLQSARTQGVLLGAPLSHPVVPPEQVHPASSRPQRERVRFLPPNGYL